MCNGCELEGGGCRDCGCHRCNFEPIVDLLETPLPRLWQAFTVGASISPRTENGLFCLSAIGTYLEDCPDLNVTHAQFWEIMLIFLNKLNERIIAERK